MRAGTALTQLVEFFEGFPDGNITWELLDGRGDQVATGTVVPVVEAVSAVITVAADDNHLPADTLAAPRELSWSYAVGGISQSGWRRYRLEAFLPLGLSEQGVRRKLGVELDELNDAAIDLVSAYSRFKESVGEDELEAVEAAGGYPEIVACDAIEALAAISLIPSLQVSLASKESSGTNQFARAAIDWEAVEARLEQYVSDGYRIVNPSVDPAINYGSLLIAVVREDPVTGEAS